MRNHAVKGAAALFLAILMAAPAGAACNASIRSIGSIETITYDPFEGDSERVEVKVEVQNDGADGCVLGLAVASQAVGSQRQFSRGADRLAYVIETGSGSLTYPNSIDVPAGSTSLDGGAGRTTNITLRLRIPSGLIAPAGSYVDDLTFRLFSQEGGGAVALGSTRTTRAQARVDARAQLNIAGSSGSFGRFELDEIDFGTLENGKVKSAVVQVRATQRVAISVRSENAGQLRHRQLSGVAGVPYTLTLDGSAIALGGSGSSITRTPAVTLAGENYPLSVRIDDVTGRPAGSYKDRLTITVVPN